MFAGILLAVAVRWRHAPLERLALGLLLVSALRAVPVYLTGEPAEHLVERIPSVAEAVIDRHEDAAQASLVAVETLGAGALAGLALFRRRTLPHCLRRRARRRRDRQHGLFGWTGCLGGQVRHTEIHTTSTVDAPVRADIRHRDDDRISERGDTEMTRGPRTRLGIRGVRIAWLRAMISAPLRLPRGLAEALSPLGRPVRGGRRVADSVLIIENDPSSVELLSYLFEREGFTVYTARDGAEGVALAGAHKPDVIVCDLLMDRMDGFQVLQIVRADPELARSTVIVVSAKSYKPDILRAKELGADAYLVKPTLPDDVLAAVHRGRELRTARKMTVKFWGTRGSIAAPGPTTTVYGGNTSCVEARVGEDILVFDSGTGIRELGLSLMKEFQGRPLTVHLFISHTHWDHIQGFPFFMPAYAAGTTLHLYGSAGPGRPLEKLLGGQMNPDYFPVALGDLAARLHVHEFRGTNFQIGETVVAATYLNHPGMTLGYKVMRAKKTLVYATDNEQYRFTLEHLGQRAEAGRQFGQRLDEEFAAFVADADLYIGEAQYTDAEYPEKIGWGHSSLGATVEVALKANVKALALFHHDPMHSDDVVATMEAEAQRLIASRGATLRCFAAREGQTIEV